MAVAIRHCVAQFIEPESLNCSLPSPSLFPKQSARFSIQRYHHHQACSLSMNGCQGDPRAPIGTVETRTFPAVSTLALAVESLNAAISNLINSHPPPFHSGIIRLEVPIKEKIEALAWLHAQNHLPLLIPRCFFSGRSLDSDPSSIAHSSNANSIISSSAEKHRVVSVAGVGSAVFFRHLHPFSFNDWLAIKRFLSKKCPLIRAYGAIRFDATASIASEWRGFGSFYFMVPQVEFDELEESSMIAATIAWDDALSWTYGKAIDELQATMSKVCSIVKQSLKIVPNTYILQNTHIPNKTSWDQAVKRALQMINRDDSTLIKVVLARSSRVVTATDVDPLMWLTCLKFEGENAYQFCLQPPESPAFIGNTPEQLFHRNRLRICSEALAGTRARGGTELLDLKIGHDLLSSPKEHNEFAIVRECIRRKLEAVCFSVLIEPKKALRKLPRVQHLYAQLTGRLQSEDDEFKILSSLHPTPAVCGYPTEVARVLIAETEMFDRGMYAGPVGWFGGGESEFAVGIRSALVEKGLGAVIYAGTGIVEGSNSSLEWDELELKTSQFTKLMKLEVPMLTSSGESRKINQRGW
ncbi:isochorismate synthase, chloroplastic isoform X2 [Ipomoea triloba]|uniref:isochorismate synthase, chloroplastic isoform X1 n=1 Tax=Ipomoea triloba TaxID=35885 RepID=UPI00125D238D|nr:isochorismate synthase, chloroplastic isoform X1 [Ipomoea triloba]XP_031105913.1 isochorismate synthase, chloroplastic isoform X2 [Ipomoea triloba]